jgi:hypothetical protein
MLTLDGGDVGIILLADLDAIWKNISRRSTMALRFEPDRVVYDPDEGLLRLFATDGLRLVRCAISEAALTALEDDALEGPDAVITTYRRNRERIQEIAQRKYRHRRFEPGGSLVIRLDDVDAAWLVTSVA